MDFAGFEPLLSPEGQRLLMAAMSSYGEGDVLTLSRRLRRLDGGYPADLVAAALTQVSLRRSARVKFGDAADRMYFTPAGLEQATHPVVAAHRAARARKVTGGGLVDLGCGIGSDLVAFARAGFAVRGIDDDDLTVAVAAANLLALGVTGSVARGRAEDAEVSGSDVVFADPSRRKGSTRVFDPRAFSPGWDFVLALLSDGTAMRGATAVADAPTPESGVPRPGVAPLAVVKLAPGLDHRLIPVHVEAEWVSLDGELKELALWSPSPSQSPLAAPARVRRRATVLTAATSRAAAGSTSSAATDPWSSNATCTERDALDEPPPVGDVGRYLYEPDPALIRAHLVSVVVAEVDGWLLDPHIAYVVSDRAVKTPYARGFTVLETLPYKEKALRAALRRRDIGSLTIKKRGVAVTPEELRRRLGLRGSSAATLVLTRTPGSATALLVEPWT